MPCNEEVIGSSRGNSLLQKCEFDLVDSFVKKAMANKSSGDNRTRTSVSIIIVAGLCCFFYLLGAWQRSGVGKGDSIALAVTRSGQNCNILPNLNFETRHGGQADQKCAMHFPRQNMIYRERHCPPQEKKLHCLIPAPKGYVTPFPWPKSRDYVPYANAPYKSLTVEKAIQNWIQYEGNVFRFPGGGTQFPQGADKWQVGVLIFGKGMSSRCHLLQDSHEAQVQFALERGVPAVIGVLGTVKMPYPSKAFDMAHCSRCLVPWGDGELMVRILCGSKNTFLITNCFLNNFFVDRVLRPDGYWVLSGPPINWKTNYKAWQHPKEDLQEEQRKIEEIAKCLCWEKKSETGETAIWQKRMDADSCHSAQEDSEATLCKSADPDDVWYIIILITSVLYGGSSLILQAKANENVLLASHEWQIYASLNQTNCISRRSQYAKRYLEVSKEFCDNLIWYNKMEACITPSRGNGDDEGLKPFPERLFAVPPRIANGLVSGVSVETYLEDNKKWKKHVSDYKKINKLIDTGRYRNNMDMNAGLGGFAAALQSPKLWVMNVVPTIAEKNTLGVIYECGLIGIYHDWKLQYSCHSIFVVVIINLVFSSLLVVNAKDHQRKPLFYINDFEKN
ncbi:hypothetical protein RND71_040749 [Anisodus tanguticus]|uniref:Methyltransferase n=1 Tax=Anisodus tanguticus TaxID=243964 RepID=A0AAE1QW76_9SOLA|nr:hypothetical protein RND71_040749 [Anisodus tanguticus]